MPNIYDNQERQLAEGLRNVFPCAKCCAFCVGYFNLRGWNELAQFIEQLPGGSEDQACRVLVGMHRPPEEEMKALARLRRAEETVDGPTRARLKHRITESFKEQVEFGIPSDEAEASLRTLAAQLRARKVFLKAFLRYPLHAKLYLVQRNDPVTPLIGFVGSSNLTLAGLSRQGELNVDVVEQDAAQKLQHWFDSLWQDELAFDLGEDLAALIEQSWALQERVRPYLVYLKIAHSLSEEAREGEREFRVPHIFRQKGTPLLDFQEKAVSLAAHHLHRRGGVLLGDVVGLGKTLMATAIARVFLEDEGSNTLVICPPKLEPMWDYYLRTYEINGRVLSYGKVTDVLGRPDAPNARLVIIDESHNFCNREGKRYRMLRDYIERISARVLLLTATPYNKHFTDLSNQLRLFLDEGEDLHIRPERFLHQWAQDGKTDADFVAQYQVQPSSLRAFELSPYPEDWRDLMRLFLVRRTRGFIIKHYAQFDHQKQRYYVTAGGKPMYFPRRLPKRVTFALRPSDASDQYARLFADDVVHIIERLRLPRYGMAQYLVPDADRRVTRDDERRVLANLNRAGRRLIGFCRTNLFKRLESSGYSFLLSLERHITRNMVTLHAITNRLPIPIGAQDAAQLDTAISDIADDATDGDDTALAPPSTLLDTLEGYMARAASIYQTFATQPGDRFTWIDPDYFRPELAEDLRADAEALLTILRRAGSWNARADAKLAALEQLLVQTHPHDKVLIFTQFADTALYLRDELARRGIPHLEVVTNQTGDPVSLARRFSPRVNGGLRPGETELRVLIATDVLAEGQNLQDAHIVVNYDLPWAIIRLIQRAGRVDRIGQQHESITVYSFMPAEGVERIINLRRRLVERLRHNQEVIGTDETFFGEDEAATLRDLYTEKAGVLDTEPTDEDIDLASLALQVWNSASSEDQRAALALPPLTSATRSQPETADPRNDPPGVITYLRYPDGSDALVRVDDRGNLVSQSFSAIFRAAACGPDTPPLPRTENHYGLVERCVEIASQEQLSPGGHLGSLRSVRRKLYERLERFRDRCQHAPSLFNDQLAELNRIMDLVWRHPLTSAASDAIGRQLRLGISDEDLFELVRQRAADQTLCVTTSGEDQHAEPHIICSLGLVRNASQPSRTPDTE